MITHERITGNGKQTFLGFVFVCFSLIIKAYSALVHTISLNTVPTPKTSSVIWETHTHTTAANHGERGGCGKKQQKLHTEQQAKFKTHKDPAAEEQRCV